VELIKTAYVTSIGGPRLAAVQQGGGDYSFVVTFTDHPQSGMIYYFHRVCLSVCQTITLESLDVGSSYLRIGYISMQYASSSYMKVIGSRSRSQEPKTSKMPIPAM